MARIKTFGNNDNDRHECNDDNDNEKVDEMSVKYSVHTAHVCFGPSSVVVTGWWSVVCLSY